VSQFQAGEEAVTVALLPLIMTIAQEGRLEEEMYLTSFLFEEAKHTEFFRLFLNAIGETRDLSEFHTPAYRKIFYEILPAVMNRLRHDQSPEAIADAATVYNMFVEGVLAETGYWSFYETLNKIGKMPGLMKGVGLLKQDESRHIGYASFLLQRLICEHPHLFERIQNKLENELMPLSAQLNEESRAYGNPYGINPEESRNFSLKQMNNRLSVLARAKGKTVEEIYQTPETALGVLS
jgi:ribonucleoside-diphosphate reductase beta chain